MFPVQIENVLTEHHGIREAAAVSVPDTRFGEVVGAWVVLEPHTELSREEVRKQVSENMNPQVRRPSCLVERNLVTRKHRMHLHGSGS